jgi:hypothetical protein
MNWYYAKNGAQQGPISLEDMKSRIAMGEISATDLAWQEGMSDWMPIGSIAELKLEPAPPRPETGPYAAHAGQASQEQAPAPEPYRPPAASPAAAPAAYQASQPPSQGLAITSLICGILSLVGCCAWFVMLPVGLVAVVLGFVALSKVKNDPARYAGKGMARAGLITGILGLIASGVMAVVAVQLQGLSPDEMQEKIINWFPLSEEQRNEIRREMEKNKRPAAP